MSTLIHALEVVGVIVALLLTLVLLSTPPQRGHGSQRRPPNAPRVLMGGGKVPLGKLPEEGLRPPVGRAGTSTPQFPMYGRCHCGGQYVLPDAPRPQVQTEIPKAPPR